MSNRRHTTRTQDAEFLLRAMTDATRSWKVGDECQSFRSVATTTVTKLDGQFVDLADGTSGHVTRMRRPVCGK